MYKPLESRQFRGMTLGQLSDFERL